MGRNFCHLSLGKVFVAASKPFSVCGWKRRSLSSLSSLFGLQAFEIKQTGEVGLAEIILPVFGLMVPILPNAFVINQHMAVTAAKTTTY